MTRRRPGETSAAVARVLIVDDETDLAELVASAFEGHGHEVRVAADAGEAVVFLAEFNPEVAIVDLGLLDSDGFALEKELRSRTSIPLRLVAFTGRQREDAVVQRFFEASGFHAYVGKPATIDQLLDAAGLRRLP